MDAPLPPSKALVAECSAMLMEMNDILDNMQLTIEQLEILRYRIERRAQDARSSQPRAD